MVSSETQWLLILKDGGLGDLVCELVAVDYCIKHWPHIKFQVWLPDYLYEFAKHVLSGYKHLFPFSMAHKFDPSILGTTTEWCTNHTCMRTHPVDYGFHMLCDRHVYDLNQKNYLQVRPKEISLKKFNLPDRFVAIACTAVEPVKRMPTETANAVIDWCVENDLVPVFIGKEHEPIGQGLKAIKAKPLQINYHKGLNLMNKTSVLEVAGVISKARAFVGMDSGLAHVAGCTDTCIVAGYTLVDPIHVSPIRQGSSSYKFVAIEPDSNIPNRYFQTYSNFIKGDYRTFPGWEQVVGNMTPEKFINALDKVLGAKSLKFPRKEPICAV